MSVSAFMAFLLCSVVIFPLSEAKGENDRAIPTLFFVIAGDASYKQVVRGENTAEVQNHLQYDILKDVQNTVQGLTSLNTVLLFDAPDTDPSFVQFYEHGTLISEKEVSDDFTDPETLASVLKEGYSRFPSGPYYFMYWGFSIPPYPASPYDMSHPSQSFSFENLKKSFSLAESYRDGRKFDSILLSTCYNSSFEALLFLGSFTRSMVATEIYLYHRGFPVDLISILSQENTLDAKLELLHKMILQKLEEWIPKGPATGKSVLDISVSVVKTDNYWDLFDALESIFGQLGDWIGRGERLDEIGSAFKKALLRKSRGQVFDEPWVDVETLVHELASCLNLSVVEQFNESYQNVLIHHEAPPDTNIRGINIYLPVFTYRSLKAFQQKLETSYFRGTSLPYFIHALSEKYFEILGAHRKDDLSPDLKSLVPFFEKDVISPSIVRSFRNGEAVSVDQTFKGVLQGKGKYFGRIGTHELILVSGERVALHADHLNLDRWISKDFKSYQIRGNIKLVRGSALLEVESMGE